MQDESNAGGVTTTSSATKSATGKVRKIVSDRGFGFIEVEGEERDVFFHHSTCDGVDFEALVEGQEVKIEYGPNKKGVAAEKVSPV